MIEFNYNIISALNFVENKTAGLIAALASNSSLSIYKYATTNTAEPSFPDAKLSDLSNLYLDDCLAEYKICQYSVRDRIALYCQAVLHELSTYNLFNDAATNIVKRTGTNTLALYSCNSNIEFFTNPLPLRYVACFGTKAPEILDGYTGFKSGDYYYNNGRNISSFLNTFVQDIINVVGYNKILLCCHINNDITDASGNDQMRNIKRYIEPDFPRDNTALSDFNAEAKATWFGKLTDKFLFRQNNIYKALNVDFRKSIKISDAGSINCIVENCSLLLELYNFYVTLQHVVQIAINIEFLQSITSTSEVITINNTFITSTSYDSANTHWYRAIALLLVSNSEWVVHCTPFRKSHWPALNSYLDNTLSESDKNTDFSFLNLFYMAEDNFLSTKQNFSGNIEGSNGIFSYYITVLHKKPTIMSLLQFINEFLLDNIISLKNILTIIDRIFYKWLLNISTVYYVMNMCHSNCHINAVQENTGEWECICGKWVATMNTDITTFNLSPKHVNTNSWADDD